MSYARVAVAFVLLFASAPEVAAQNEHFYRLTVTECRHGNAGRVLSGFRDRQHHGIVTALHGVAGCSSVVAVNATNNRTYRLNVIKGVDVDRDIVLLSSLNFAAETPTGLELAPSLPAGGLRVVGFPHALPAAISSTVSLHQPARVQLNALLPSGQRNRTALDVRLSPNPRVQVLSVQGHLTLGHSGAPILDASNRVVGIANGGLERGAIEISWAIPYFSGAANWKAPADVEPELQRVNLLDPRVLFSFAEEEPTYPPVGCFGRRLDFVRSATLSDLVSTVDDPLTYQQLLYSYQLTNFAASFLIFRDVEGDVSIVVPNSWNVAPNGSNSCIVRAPSRQGLIPLEIEYQLIDIQSDAAFVQIDQIVRQAQFGEFFSKHFIIDQTNSNWMPRYDLDRGIVARRFSFFQNDRFCGPFGLPPQPAAAQRPPGFPEPFVQPNGMPACASGVVYPDSWFAAGPGNWQDYIVGAGFGSYLGNEERLLIAQVSVNAPGLGQQMAECTWGFSRTPECRQAIESQRRFAQAAVAATASAVGGSGGQN